MSSRVDEAQNWINEVRANENRADKATQVFIDDVKENFNNNSQIVYRILGQLMNAWTDPMKGQSFEMEAAIAFHFSHKFHNMMPEIDEFFKLFLERGEEEVEWNDISNVVGQYHKIDESDVLVIENRSACSNAHFAIIRDRSLYDDSDLRMNDYTVIEIFREPSGEDGYSEYESDAGQTHRSKLELKDLLGLGLKMNELNNEFGYSVRPLFTMSAHDSRPYSSKDANAIFYYTKLVQFGNFFYSNLEYLRGEYD